MDVGGIAIVVVLVACLGIYLAVKLLGAIFGAIFGGSPQPDPQLQRLKEASERDLLQRQEAERARLANEARARAEDAAQRRAEAEQAAQRAVQAAERARLEADERAATASRAQAEGAAQLENRREQILRDAHELAESEPQVAVQTLPALLTKMPALRVAIARAHRNLGDPASALREAQEVLRAEPESFAARVLSAQCLLDQGMAEPAALALERAVAGKDVNAATVDAFYELGGAHEKTGKLERALEAYGRILGYDAAYRDVGERLRRLRDSRASGGALYSTPASAPALGDRATQYGDGPAASATPAGAERFERIRSLGTGGMGQVWLAKDRTLGRLVAIKEVRAELRSRPKAVERFVREARAAAAVSGENLVTLHDIAADASYLVMEYVEGGTLRDLIEDADGPLPIDTAIAHGKQIARALEVAHGKGIVHRDLKPENILVTPEGLCKVADFGLAKAVEASRAGLTQQGAIIGTAAYMSPQQALGMDLDHRTDLYSFGVVLYEMLCGRPPFISGDLSLQHRDVSPMAPRERNAAVPGWLDGLVLSCLSKRPEERPASASVISRALATAGGPNLPSNQWS